MILIFTGSCAVFQTLALPERICDLSLPTLALTMAVICLEKSTAIASRKCCLSSTRQIKTSFLLHWHSSYHCSKHILSPDSHGRSGVKLSLSSDIVGIRKHIHSQLRQVPSPYSALLELFRQVTNPVGYHMPIMIHCIIVTSSSHYFAINIGFVYAVSYLDYPQGKGSLLFVVIYCSSSEQSMDDSR